MKGIAIGLSNNSIEILKRLKKTEYVKDIYIAGSSEDDGKENELIEVEKPRKILLKKMAGDRFNNFYRLNCCIDTYYKFFFNI